MTEYATNMEVVKCVCGNQLLMKSECDFEDIETDTWTFNLSVECHDSLNGCCKGRIMMGIDNTVRGLIRIQELAEMNRNYVIHIDVPEELRRELGEEE